MKTRLRASRCLAFGVANVAGAISAAAAPTDNQDFIPPLPQLRIPAVSVPLPIPPPLRRHFVECNCSPIVENVEYEKPAPTALGLIELFGTRETLLQAMSADEVTVYHRTREEAAGKQAGSKTTLSVAEAARVATILTTDSAYDWNHDDPDTIDYRIDLEFRKKGPVSVGRLPPEYRQAPPYDYRIELRRAGTTVAAELASGSRKIRIETNSRPVAEAWLGIGHALIEDILARCERAAHE